MSDLSVKDADVVTLLAELENRGLFQSVVITHNSGQNKGRQELKAVIPINPMFLKIKNLKEEE
tara:strand:- start:522 stop:710 length:189 start_codon:yes stop_codon:yes gene_type:complete